MPTFEMINSKLLCVRLNNEEVFTKRGAMIAYKGNVTFAKSSGGAGFGQAAMRVVTNENLQLMVSRGSGEVFYAYLGKHVTLLKLNGERFYAESESILAYDSRLRAGTEFMGNQGGMSGLVRGAVTGQGLFTTTLEGHGELAVLSDGDMIGIDVNPSNPVFVDPDAYIGHRGQLTSSIKTDVSWKTFVGQTSGESYQLQFTGNGTVYIQASER
ncbi:MAG: AIM24 family protein [Acidobacteria bacterium]|nr:AIM24 family protein [Acidobacteriota bacterium]